MTDAKTPAPITYYDPVLVACRIGNTTAIWQVETDPAVRLGDFSGAWLINEQGIQGFAADADWIEDRKDPQAMAKLLLAGPVFITNESQGEVDFGAGGVVKTIDQQRTQQAAQDAIAAARAEFAAANEGKNQPAWGEIRDIVPVDGRAPEGLDEDATLAVTSVLAHARGVRAWVRDWVAFDKVRARRLGSLPAEVRPVPIVTAE